MSIVDSMYIIKKTIDRSLNKVAKDSGLTLNEIRVLLFLYENEKFDIASDIVEELMISKAHVSLSVEELAKKSYIEKVRSKEDKKKVHLKINNNAKEVLDLLDIEIKKLKENLLKDISDKDVLAFKETLKKIIENTKYMK